MAGPLLLKRKTKKSPKRLGRPQKNKKLDLECVYNLLNALKKVLKGQKNPQTKRRLDFGDNSPQKSYVLPKPIIYIPKIEQNKTLKDGNEEAKFYRKFHRLADEVVSDDEDLLMNCHRLAEKFATLKVNKDSQPKTEDDCAMLEIPNLPTNIDEKFLKACQRSAQKIAKPKIIKDSHDETALPIKPKSENEIVETAIPKANPSTETIHTDKPEEKSDNIPKANPLVTHEIVPMALENKPEESPKIGMPKSNPSVSLEIVPNPLKSKPEENGDKIANLKPSADLEIVKEPSKDKPEKTSKIGVVKSNPSPKMECIDLTDDSLNKDSKPAEKKTEQLEIVPKPAEKKTVNIISQKPKSNSSVKLEAVPKPADKKTEKIIPKTVVPVKKNSVSIKDFRFSTAEKKKVGEYHSNTFNATGASNKPGQTRGHPMPNRRYIIIDGSNVAFAHGNSSWFSSEGIKYCLQYFDKMGHNAKAVIPLFRRNAFQSTSPRIIEELYKEGKIVFTPCKNFLGQKSISYDDRFILQLAYELDAGVVSNDNYRDLIGESPAFRWIVENRVIGYTWCDNILMLPKDPYGRRRPSLDDILQC